MLQIFIKDIFPQNNNFPYFHFYNEKLYSFVGYFLFSYLKSASNLNGNLNCSKELEHYAS